jgi:hypothetical protein
MAAQLLFTAIARSFKIFKIEKIIINQIFFNENENKQSLNYVRRPSLQ